MCSSRVGQAVFSFIARRKTISSGCCTEDTRHGRAAAARSTRLKVNVGVPPDRASEIWNLSTRQQDGGVPGSPGSKGGRAAGAGCALRELVVIQMRRLISSMPPSLAPSFFSLQPPPPGGPFSFPRSPQVNPRRGTFIVSVELDELNVGVLIVVAGLSTPKVRAL